MKTCEFPNCGYPVLSKNLCNAHYQQRHRGLEPYPIDRPDYEFKNCLVTNCENPLQSRGLCARHASISNRFSISPTQMATIYDQGCQNPGCKATENLAIDHDHSCCPGNDSCGNCVRGVLCRGCNIVLGWVEKGGLDEEGLQGLLEYLSGKEHFEVEPFEPAYRTPRRLPGN